MPHKQYSKDFLLQVTKASYINQVLTPTTCNFPNLFIQEIKLINLLNIHFSIFHLYLLHIF